MIDKFAPGKRAVSAVPRNSCHERGCERFGLRECPFCPHCCETIRAKLADEARVGIEHLLKKSRKCRLLLSFVSYLGCKYRKRSNSPSNSGLLSVRSVPFPTLRRGGGTQRTGHLALPLPRRRMRFELIAYRDHATREGGTIKYLRLRLTRAFSRIYSASANLANAVLGDCSYR